MRTRNTKRKDRWYLPNDNPLSRLGYIYNRGGIAYLCVGTCRVTSKLPFIEQSKIRCFDMLIDMIENLNFRKSNSVSTFSDAIKLYFKSNNNLNEKRIEHLTIAIKALITEEYYLNETDELRQHILDNVKLLQNTKSPKRNSNYSSSTINAYLNSVNQITSFMLSEGLISKNPINIKLHQIKSNEQIVLTYTPDEIIKIKDYFADNLEMLYLIELALITGARVNELVHIHWNDITDDYIVIHGKGDRDRPFPISPFPELKELLTKIKLHKPNGYLFRLQTPTQYQRFLQIALKKIGLYAEGKNFHSFRKTRENELIDNSNFNAEDVADLLGHSIAMQKEHYRIRLQGKELNEKLLKSIERNRLIAQFKHTTKR